MGRKYGYARCPAGCTKQDVNRQIKELVAKGVARDDIFLEYESSTKPNRRELARLLNEAVMPGDEIIVLEVSRVTRSTRQLCEFISLCRNRKLRLSIGSLVMDCTRESDPVTEGMLKMTGMFAELERSIISSHIKSGQGSSRANGHMPGRPRLTGGGVPAKVRENYELYRDGLINKTDYAKMCSVSRPTLYKYIGMIARE